jgi:hypothetical protein
METVLNNQYNTPKLRDSISKANPDSSAAWINAEVARAVEVLISEDVKRRANEEIAELVTAEIDRRTDLIISVGDIDEEEVRRQVYNMINDDEVRKEVNTRVNSLTNSKINELVNDPNYIAFYNDVNTYIYPQYDWRPFYDHKLEGVMLQTQTAVIIERTVTTEGGIAKNEVIYGQSDAGRAEVEIWAEAQGVETPVKVETFVLPIPEDAKYFDYIISDRDEWETP